MLSHAFFTFIRRPIYCDESVSTTSRSPPKQRTQEEVGQELTSCMLSQSYGFLAGTLVGFIIGYRRKSLTPLVQGVALGTAVDVANGYCFMCKSLREEYDSVSKGDNV